MPTPLDYERFRMAQGRFDRQGSQFDTMMDYRNDQFDYRQERDLADDQWRQQRAAQQDRMALLRMLPQAQRGAAIYGRPMSGPAAAEADYEAALGRQDAMNFAAVPSWQAERDRSDFARDTGMDLRAYAAQQQMRQMGQLQAREQAVMQPLNDMMARQAEADATAAKEKADFENMSRLGKIYGAPVGDLYGGYDAKTGASTLPGDYVSDGAGGFTQKPGRKIAITPGHAAAMRAYMSGKEGPLEQSPAQQLGARITQLAGERRIMPQAIEAAREKLKRKGVFTERDIIDALEQEDALWFTRNRSQMQAWKDTAEADRSAAFEEEARQQFRRENPLIRGMTPLALP